MGLLMYLEPAGQVLEKLLVEESQEIHVGVTYQRAPAMMPRGDHSGDPGQNTGPASSGQPESRGLMGIWLQPHSESCFNEDRIVE